MAGFLGGDATIFQRKERIPLRRPTLAGRPWGTEGATWRDRQTSWVQAAKGGPQSPGSFLNAGPITDTVNLGTVALRANKVVFDSENLKITNAAGANGSSYGNTVAAGSYGIDPR